MYQKPTKHPVSETLQPLETDTFEAMFDLFKHIGMFWNNLPNPETYKSRLYAFMENRINIIPIYQEYYKLAKKTIEELITEHGEEEAYRLLFTDQEANQPPAITPLAVTRQKVSNEFIAFQLAQGGFKVFGAKNYPGYIGGANIPGKPIPYRSEGE